jgi:N-methylhydantoinase A
MGLRIAIDTGGTFTDIVAIDEHSGHMTATKTPSTPEDPSLGLVEGVRKVLKAAGGDPGDVHMLLHGSTVATNAVLEHKFDGLGLLVTKGFRHLIEIARQSVPDGYGNSFFWVKPRRLVPLHLVREAPGRLRFDGSEIEPLDEAAVLAGVRELVEDGVRCVAVCLLHAYANDAHEKRVGELIAQHFPDIFVSLSSVVLPEYREYERAMTTLIDVLVKPYCRTYLQRAADKIRATSGNIPFLIMQSNGGIVKHSTAGERPVTMLLSGPAAGVLGSVHTAQLAGYRDILTIDVGGTSTDVSIIENHQPRYTSTATVESYPVKTPMLDIVTVGSGGGSIVWTDSYGQLKVGPQSAGANPGPICYGKGGSKPTVTDAAVALGRLPAALVGGEIALDAAAARQAFVTLGQQLGLDPDELAAGALEIAAANQVFGIRQVTTVRGREPGDYAMVAFGGAGGLFATEVADFLGIGTVISPPDPGNLCAFGLHVCDVTRDYIRTLVRRQSVTDADEILAVWRELERLGFSDIEAEGISKESIAIQFVADVRYFGEGHEVHVEIPEGLTGPPVLDFMWEEFHNVHDRTFGFNYRGQQDVELVNLRVRAVGRQSRPQIKAIESVHGNAVPFGERKVYWRTTGWIDVPLFNRAELALDQHIAGPAIVEEYGSTIVMPPGWSLRTDRYRNLILKHDPEKWKPIFRKDHAQQPQS